MGPTLVTTTPTTQANTAMTSDLAMQPVPAGDKLPLKEKIAPARASSQKHPVGGKR